ncbi:MAG: histidine phosphatase family protein [Alphaproteobacteria bacterium]|nr:histidine phosphatase family protein [Alphaproteobacteria bacterium]
MHTLPGTTGRRRIYLMRHGHVDYLAPEVVASGSLHVVPLTSRGKLEAQAAGRALAGVVLDRVICSGLPRTRETAEVVRTFLDPAPPLEVDQDLVEIRGGLPNTPISNRRDLIAVMSFEFARAAEAGATMMQGGEAFTAAQARSIGAIQRVLCRPDWRQMLIVAHEGINRLILSWAAGTGLSATSAFEQDTGCINVLDFDMVPADDDGREPKIERVLIKAVNLTPYNYLKHGMNLTSLEAIFDRDFALERI